MLNLCLALSPEVVLIQYWGSEAVMIPPLEIAVLCLVDSCGGDCSLFMTGASL